MRTSSPFACLRRGQLPVYMCVCLRRDEILFYAAKGFSHVCSARYAMLPITYACRSPHITHRVRMHRADDDDDCDDDDAVNITLLFHL